MRHKGQRENKGKDQKGEGRQGGRVTGGMYLTRGKGHKGMGGGKG